MPYFIFISPLVYQYFLTTISLSKKLGEKLNEFSFQFLELKTENEFHIHVCYCIEFQSDFNSFASTRLHTFKSWSSSFTQKLKIKKSRLFTHTSFTKKYKNEMFWSKSLTNKILLKRRL